MSSIESPKLMPRLRALDALRFVAALSVVMFHYTSRDSVAWGKPTLEAFPALSHASTFGALGVYGFFMISGFVILMSAWGRTLRDFTASRIARLYPAYWVAVLITGALIVLVRPEVAADKGDVGPSEVLVNLSMIQRIFGVPNVDGVYWTLWAELKFYVLIAILIGIGLTRRKIIAVACLWPALGIVPFLLDNEWWKDALTSTQAPLFCFGMMLYLIYREGFRRTLVVVAGLNFALIMYYSFYAYYGLTTTAPGQTVSRVAVAAVVAGAAALIFIATMTPVAHINWSWLTTLGALTYPLYLLHEQLGWWTIAVFRSTFHLPDGVNLGVNIALYLFLAWAVHVLVERRLGPWLRRMIAGRKPPQEVEQRVASVGLTVP